VPLDEARQVICPLAGSVITAGALQTLYEVSAATKASAPPWPPLMAFYQVRELQDRSEPILGSTRVQDRLPLKPGCHQDTYRVI
jgi:hypothetical protein